MNKTLLICFMGLAACSSPEKNKAIAEGSEIHNAAIEVGKEVNKTIWQIDQYMDSLSASEEVVMIDSIDAIKEDLKYWETLMAESPVIEEEVHDHHDHDHNHDHNHSDDLTPEMILDIQKDLYDQAMRLDARSKRLLEIIETEK